MKKRTKRLVLIGLIIIIIILIVIFLNSLFLKKSLFDKKANIIGNVINNMQYECNPNPPNPTFVSDQTGNLAYCPNITNPAYPYGTGPKVLFDEGHNNWGKISPSNMSPTGTYYALGELLKADGYQVDINKGNLTSELLQNYKILIIIAPLPAEYMTFDNNGKVIANPDAFSGKQALSNEEVIVISNWVKSGGSLLLNAEHIPFLNSIQNLLNIFKLSTPKDFNDIIFPAQPRLVSDSKSPILTGRYQSEKITSFPKLNNVGGGANLIGGGENLAMFNWPSIKMSMTLQSALANHQWNAYCRNNSNQTCKNIQQTWLQGQSFSVVSGVVPIKTLSMDLGRVIVFSEFSTLTNLFDKSGSTTVPYGGLTNPVYTQFILNSLHWLSGLI